MFWTHLESEDSDDSIPDLEYPEASSTPSEEIKKMEELFLGDWEKTKFTKARCEQKAPEDA